MRTTVRGLLARGPVRFDRGIRGWPVVLFLLWSGCVMSPLQDQHIPTRSTPVDFQADVLGKNSIAIEVQCRPHGALAAWTSVAKVDSQAPGSFVVPDRCWAGSGTYTADVRFVSPRLPRPLFGLDLATLQCFEDKLVGEENVPAAFKCVLTKGRTFISIHADAP